MQNDWRWHMGSLTIRNLDDNVIDALKAEARAKTNALWKRKSDTC